MQLIAKTGNEALARDTSGNEFIGVLNTRGIWTWKNTEDKTPTARQVVALGRMAAKYLYEIK